MSLLVSIFDQNQNVVKLCSHNICEQNSPVIGIFETSCIVEILIESETFSKKFVDTGIEDNLIFPLVQKYHNHTH